MMFDVTDRKMRWKTQWLLIRKMTIVERSFRKKIRTMINHQYAVVVKHAMFGIFDINHAIDSLRGLLVRELSEQYTRVGAIFYDLIEDELDDDPKTNTHDAEFWRAYHLWTLRAAHRQVNKINDTTKRLMGRVLNEARNKMLSNDEIVKKLIENGIKYNKLRAIRIARTEVHSSAMYAIDEAVRSTDVQYEREWLSILEAGRADHKVLDGMRVKEGEAFKIGEHRMMYPGDPSGPADHVVNCRCVLIYHRPTTIWRRDREE